MNQEQLISEMLLLPAAAIDYHISQHVLKLFPDKALLESEGHLDVEGYAEAKNCTLTRRTFTYNQMNTYWRGPEPQLLRPHSMMYAGGGFSADGMHPFPTPTATTTAEVETHDAVNKAWFEEQWQGNALDMLILHIQGEGFQKAHFWLLADAPDIARRFLAAVARWQTEIRGEVLVFDNGQWSKDEYLFQDIKHATFEFNIRQVFERARRTAPCVLVLEDLDSLLTLQNRAFFLNELDGFASNIGIVTLATTNHPERLDSSILDRPSRFDRKYPFDLPELPERTAYVSMWNSTLKSSLRLSEEGVTKISELTDGFSFAYLKELFLSSKMRWIATPQEGTMEEVMAEQVGKLREQMVSVSMAPMPEMPEELEGMPPMFGPRMARGMLFRRRT
jgi:hypothetical protein